MRLPDGIRRLFRIDGYTRGIEREIDDEIDHHLEQATRDYLSAGLDEPEARERARRRFGDERAYRRTLRAIDDGRVTMRERSEWIDGVARTCTFAWRGLRKSPGFSAAVVSILALGIGANAVMFGVVDRLLLSPPQHVVAADEVRTLHVRRIGFNGDVFIGSTITHPDLLDFHEVSAFSAVAAYTTPREFTVGRGGAAARARVSLVSAELFPLLGVQPAAGRFFGPDEAGIGDAPTAVLAHEYWERALGSDPSAIGSTLEVGPGTYTIVGVAPRGFTGAILAPVDIWLPLETAHAIESGDGWVGERGWYWLSVVARLAPGGTEQAAIAEATAVHRAGRAEMIERGRYDAEVEVLLAPLIAARGPNPSRESDVARWLAGVSLVVLLIACANVANLLLARAVRRRREIAVRLSLGVHRGRLALDVVAESFLLAALGAAAAVVVARVLGDTIHQALLPDVAFSDSMLAGRLLAFTVVVTAVAGLATGLVPAFQATRADVADTLRASARAGGRDRSRLRAGLLVGQAALSVVLLVGAGLFVRSLARAQTLDLGFDADRLVVVSLEWNETLPPEERHAIYASARDRVLRLPGVRAAGLTYTVPFRSSISLGQPRVPGVDSIPRHHNGGPYVNKVGSGYFESMGLSILRGRAFQPSDDAPGAPPVAVLSASMAEAIWPDGRAIGRCMVVGDEPDAPCTEVVGVVENHRRQSLVEDDPHFLYYLNESHPGFVGPPQSLMVGLDAPAAGPVVRRIHEVVRGSSGQIRFASADAMTDYVAPQLRSWRLGASMFTVFGLLALVVAGWGLYSVLAFDVALRRHEIGVRSALGADRSTIVGMILRQAVVFVSLGTAVGLALSAGASRYVEPLLFRVSPLDPATYVLVALVLLLVASAAGSVPAWRAARVEAREALQAE